MRSRSISADILPISVLGIWAAYCTAYCDRFEGSLKDVLWLSFFLVLSHPVMTIEILLFLVMGTALALLVPFLVLFLPSLICLAISPGLKRSAGQMVKKN